jgi:hypothetical protein
MDGVLAGGYLNELILKMLCSSCMAFASHGKLEAAQSARGARCSARSARWRLSFCERSCDCRSSNRAISRSVCARVLVSVSRAR